MVYEYNNPTDTMASEILLVLFFLARMPDPSVYVVSGPLSSSRCLTQGAVKKGSALVSAVLASGS